LTEDKAVYLVWYNTVDEDIINICDCQEVKIKKYDKFGVVKSSSVFHYAFDNSPRTPKRRL
jgi:hypothetical protein